MFRYAYWAVGETELAVDDFTAAVELKADYSEARLNRAQLYIGQADMYGALMDLMMIRTQVSL